MPAGAITTPPSDMDDPAVLGDTVSRAECRSGATGGGAGTSGRTDGIGTAALARAYGDSGYLDAPGGDESVSGSTSGAGWGEAESFGSRARSPGR
jgi:hypothetical protein